MAEELIFNEGGLKLYSRDVETEETEVNIRHDPAVVPRLEFNSLIDISLNPTKDQITPDVFDAITAVAHLMGCKAGRAKTSRGHYQVFLYQLDATTQQAEPLEIFIHPDSLMRATIGLMQSLRDSDNVKPTFTI